MVHPFDLLGLTVSPSTMVHIVMELINFFEGNPRNQYKERGQPLDAVKGTVSRADLEKRGAAAVLFLDRLTPRLRPEGRIAGTACNRDCIKKEVPQEHDRGKFAFLPAVMVRRPN